MDSCSKIFALDFVLIRFGKVTDVKTTAFERRNYYLYFLRERSMTFHAGPHGEAPGFDKRQKRVRRRSWTTVYYCPWEKQIRPRETI